ncbi:MAG: hypothetical protein GWM98_15430 [Nitrospinaceae bacterium]|nr:hypothetical protein [Nitrospinaceae bacterium]NIR55616.1 hypothetical protein [Nitrospinaceae bacterium]NIS86050.1 hypothetical protein [Nitrospinaceae bacterium]NIT82893.1 hypothetical protein [Nitrospinaceae bacterium]NIU45098.1 hypothetical protein [Nitrospinaceae bacterium]
MDWRIYYGDGGTFSSDDGPPWEAPPHNVMAVAQKDARLGRAVYNQWDWYFYSDEIGGWYGADLFGIIDQVMHNCNRIRAVIQGRVTTSERFTKILDQARNDPDLPRKSAKGGWESRGQKYGNGFSE